MSLARLALGAKLEAQAQASFITPNPRLDAAVANATANGLPPISIYALQGQYLSIQCQLMGAKNVLEIGSLGGYSTIWLASSGAKVTSIEIDPKHAEVSRENCKGLDIDIILGSALDVLPKLDAEGKVFDVVFIDADWEMQAEFFKWAVKLTRVGGCVIIDNVVRQLLETEEIGKENILTKVGAEKRVMATLVSTISGQKTELEDMYDGFMVAIVKDA